MKLSIGRRVADLAIAASLLLLATAATWTAFSYPRSSGLFPIFAGWLFIALVTIEVWVQLQKTRHAAADEGTAGRPELQRDGILPDLGGPAWLGFLLLLIYLAGFVVAIPTFLFLFLLLAAKRPATQSALVAIVLTALVYIVFSLLLRYRLFAGIFFGG